MSVTCVFCEIVAGTAQATIVFEEDATMAFLPLPDGRLAEGHVLVIPKRHIADVFEANLDDLSLVSATVQKVSEALRQSIGASGVNLLNASGPNSDQSVFHLHFHVVPRWQDDGLWTWPEGRSTHPVPGDYVARLRDVLSRDTRRR